MKLRREFRVITPQVWSRNARKYLMSVFPAVHQSEISRMLGEWWRQLTPSERESFRLQSLEEEEMMKKSAMMAEVPSSPEMYCPSQREPTPLVTGFERTFGTQHNVTPLPHSNASFGFNTIAQQQQSFDTFNYARMHQTTTACMQDDYFTPPHSPSSYPQPYRVSKHAMEPHCSTGAPTSPIFPSWNEMVAVSSVAAPPMKRLRFSVADDLSSSTTHINTLGRVPFKPLVFQDCVSVDSPATKPASPATPTPNTSYTSDIAKQLDSLSALTDPLACTALCAPDIDLAFADLSSPEWQCLWQ